MPALQPGFADLVGQAQAVFRAVMTAMAEPGRIVTAGADLAPPAPLGPAAAAVLLALSDPETPVWFDGDAGDAGDAAAWLRFHCGAPLAEDPAAAAFALLDPAGAVSRWGHFALGSAEAPHLAATLLLPVAALEGGAPLALRGPGIDGVTWMAPEGLPAGFAAAMAGNGARFPAGFDLILTCGARLLALQRTTRITEA